MSEEEGVTCHKEVAPSGPPLIQDGNIVFQAHHVGWIVASFFTLVACAVSFWLVNMHLQYYTNKREQRYIVRILLMVPIYAAVTLASYFFWNTATPLILIRDCYEAIVLTAFFYLLLVYLSPNAVEQRLIFARHGLSREADRTSMLKGEKLKKWVWPLGFVKAKPSDGLFFLQAMKWGVLQYCVLRPLTTLAAIILDYTGLYCETSWGFGWGHIYIVIIVSLSVTISMYCLIQLYVVVSDLLKPRRPLLKLFAIKAVVFLTFWQATFLSLLAMVDIVKDTKYMTAEDVNIGIGALIQTFEMMLFAVLHVWAFSYKPYRPIQSPGSKEPPLERTHRMRSFGHAIDFRETFREIWHGSVYLLEKMRRKEPKADARAKRVGHFQSLFGRTRSTFLENDGEKSGTRHEGHPRQSSAPAFPSVRIDIEEQVEITGERQWLGLGDNYAYGLHRERSEGLEDQIERELERRGYGTHIPGRGHIKALPSNHELDINHKPQRSWWHSIYKRLSQANDEQIEEGVTRLSSQRRFTHRHHAQESDAARFLFDSGYEMDDPPPRSIIAQHPHKSTMQETRLVPSYSAYACEDILSRLVFSDRRCSPVRKQEQRYSTSKSPHHNLRTHMLAGDSGYYLPNLDSPSRSPDTLWSAEEPHRISETMHSSVATPNILSVQSHNSESAREMNLQQDLDPLLSQVSEVALGSHRRESAFHTSPLPRLLASEISRPSDVLIGSGAAAPRVEEARSSTPSTDYETPPSSPLPLEEANIGPLPIRMHNMLPPTPGLRRVSAHQALAISRDDKHLSLPPQTDTRTPLRPPQQIHVRRDDNFYPYQLQYNRRLSVPADATLTFTRAPNLDRDYLPPDPLDSGSRNDPYTHRPNTRS